MYLCTAHAEVQGNAKRRCSRPRIVMVTSNGGCAMRGSDARVWCAGLECRANIEYLAVHMTPDNG
jgi:hypothetical protein